MAKKSKADWMQFLQRGLMQFKAGDDRQGLYRLQKYGPEPNYWNEFVFKANHHQPQGDLTPCLIRATTS